MRVQDVMSKKVTTVTPQTTVAAAREALRTAEIGHLVVVDANKNIAGIVTDKDIARAAADDDPLSGVMSHPVVTVEPEATIRRAAGILRGRGINCLPVVTEGRLAGIVTTSDLLTGISKGEIHAAPQSERIVLRKRGPRKRPAPI